MKKIVSAGGEAYLVGGCVRDQLLGFPCHDYDVATNLKPEEVLSLFPESKYSGQSFGVVRVKGIEVATFRQDVYNIDRDGILWTEENGQAVIQTGVKFVGSLEEDVSRRDFTINAMAQDAKGSVIDFHHGQEDLNAGFIRFVGNPHSRILEDPIRILRGVRFAAKLNFYIESASWDAMKRNRLLVKKERRERIKIEIMKVLEEVEKPSKFFEILKEMDTLKFVLPSLDKTVGIPGGQYHDETIFEHCIWTADHLPMNKPLLRLAGLLHDIGKPSTSKVDDHTLVHFYAHEQVGAEMAYQELHDLRFPNDKCKYVSDVIKSHMFYFEEVTKLSTYRRWMAKLLAMNIDVYDILELRLADRKANKGKALRPVKTEAWRRTIDMIEQVKEEDSAMKLTDLEINGEDLIELGLTPGPIFGSILNGLFEKVLDDPSLNKKEKLLKLIRKEGIRI